MGGLADLSVTVSMGNTLTSLERFTAQRLRSNLEAGERQGADILRSAIASEAPVSTGRLRSEVVIRPHPGGGFTVGPHSGERNEAIKISAVVHGRSKGDHGTTAPNPFPDRGARKVHGEIVRLMEQRVIGR